MPYVLAGFSLALGSPVLVDILGIVSGHIYYFLEDVFPSEEGGFKLLTTPRILRWIFDPPVDEPIVRVVNNKIALS